MQYKLFFFPDTPTEMGVRPFFYDAVHPDQAAGAIAAGGLDVSDDPQAWIQFEKQIAYEYELIT